MTQEEKQLLLQDLCERLPYDTIASVTHYDEITKEAGETLGYIKGVTYNGKIEFFYLPDYTEDDGAFNRFSAENIKPYLRPMSSMTKNEKRELQNILSNNKHGVYLKHDEEWEIIVDSYYPYIPLEGFTNGFNWLNKKMFDYRGLIPMGLAIEAPEGMYETKTE